MSSKLTALRRRAAPNADMGEQERPVQSLQPPWGRASRLQRCSGAAATVQNLCKTVTATIQVNWVTTFDCVLMDRSHPVKSRLFSSKFHLSSSFERCQLMGDLLYPPLSLPRSPPSRQLHHRQQSCSNPHNPSPQPINPSRSPRHPRASSRDGEDFWRGGGGGE